MTLLKRLEEHLQNMKKIKKTTKNLPQNPIIAVLSFQYSALTCGSFGSDGVHIWETGGFWNVDLSKMLKISWIDWITSTEVLHRLNKQKNGFNTVKRGKLEYFDYLNAGKKSCKTRYISLSEERIPIQLTDPFFRSVCSSNDNVKHLWYRQTNG